MRSLEQGEEVELPEVPAEPLPEVPETPEEEPEPERGTSSAHATSHPRHPSTHWLHLHTIKDQLKAEAWFQDVPLERVTNKYLLMGKKSNDI